MGDEIWLNQKILIEYLIWASFILLIGQTDEHLGNNAGEHPIDPALKARTGHDNFLTLHPTPIQRIPRKEQVWLDVRTTTVATLPKLTRFTPSNLVEGVGPG